MAETNTRYDDPSRMKRKTTASPPPLGAKVRDMREERGWTQSQLAEIASVDVRTIQNVEGRGKASLDTCMALANAFSIEPGELTRLRGSAPSRRTSPREGLDAYGERLRNTRGSSIPPLISLRATGEPGTVAQAAIAHVEAGRHVALCGPSGCGKSHTAVHVALKLCGRPTLVILAQALRYAGNLDSWLEQATAPFSARSATALLRLAHENEMRTVVVVDDVGACTGTLLESFLGDLRALTLRNPTIALLLTATTPELLSSLGDIAVLHIEAPDPEERRNLLVAHGLRIEDLDAALEVLPALAWPFDLGLAARCWRQMSRESTRYSLIHSYSREVLEERDLGPAGFEFLCQIARQMSLNVATAVDLHVAYRMGELSRSGRSKSWQQLLSTGLVRLERLQVVFRHDLFRQFFAAEALMRSTGSVEGLATALDSPRHEELLGFVSEAQGTDDEMGGLLRSSSALRTIADELGRGLHGQVARSAVDTEIADALRACRSAIDAGRLIGTRDEETGKIHITFTTPAPMTQYQSEWLGAYAWRAATRSELSACMDLASRFDALLKREAFRADATSPDKTLRSFANQALDVRFDCPLKPILTGFRSRFSFASNIDIEGLDHWIACADLLGPVQLHAICLLLTRCHLDERTSGALAEGMPSILTAARANGAAYTYFETLHLVQYRATLLSDSAKADIRHQLENFRSRNPIVNSLILETLEALGAEFEPIVPAESLLDEVCRLLETPMESEAQERAYGILAMQFEPLSAVARPADEALDTLDASQMSRFLAMAALGAPEDSPLSCVDLCLARAVRPFVLGAAPAEARSPTFSTESNAPILHAALNRWAAPPQAPLRSPQDRVHAFVLANQGLALCGLAAPTVSQPSTLRDSAWRHFGTLVYACTKGREFHVELTERAWKELEGPLLDEVITPLVLLLDANRATPSLLPDVQNLEQTFPARITSLASKLLERVDLRANGPLFDPVGIRLLGILGRLGDTGCRPKITPLVDDPVLGAAAVAAIRQIDSRPNAGV